MSMILKNIEKLLTKFYILYYLAQSNNFLIK